MLFRKKLKKYTDRWVEKEIITPSQKVAILNEVQSKTTTESFFRILAIIGAIFIGLGIILIISANWYYFPKSFKLFMILSMPVLSISAGYYLSYVKPIYSKIGNSFIVLGSLLIGASIGLYGQLYNIDSSFGSLLILWFFLSLPLTFIFKFKALSAISVVLFYLSVFYFIQESSVWDWREKTRVMIQVFHLLPLMVLLFSWMINKILFGKMLYNVVLSTVSVISLKLLFLFLFIGTLGLREDLFLLGEIVGAEVIQNILFLGAVFFVMWYTNKNYMVSLHHTTFFWLGMYIVARYFAWFWDYMQTGIFFLSFGIILIAMVWGYIKLIKYKKENSSLVSYKESLDVESDSGN